MERPEPGRVPAYFFLSVAIALPLLNNVLMSDKILQPSDLPPMRRALALALEAAKRGEVPVGAVVVSAEGEVLGEAANACEASGDPRAHAEMLALGLAVKTAQNQRLVGATLYCTVEPCPMCAGAAVLARVSRVVFGCRQPKFGGMVSHFGIGLGQELNHRLEVVEGLLAEESAALLAQFFKARRTP